MASRERESLLDGENVGVLPMDTSDDEMNSSDGPNGNGLSPIDDDDGHSGDKGEIKSSSQYGEEYGVGTTSGHFLDRSEFDGICFLNLGEIEVNLELHQKEKAKSILL
ncbi:hypothetical protein Goshw_022563 [Gossypium schwendimanii]|uniref:Uncharacterized protein n=1 Tax=Gossypium schwendimanii TaxID=34291 RepID=A0A7J9LQ56_GOSSC|nr:hypothetical protein [Gossypium schwendimanii]